ncbi:MAG: phage tail sheath family protein, partial [Myxococcales bacterium]|nr:phage tail sheath family protein [Myxococcales bacterium]
PPATTTPSDSTTPAPTTPPAATTPPAVTLASLKTSNTALYNDIKKQLADQRVELPPSAAMAGIYARVDRERGVWKAPANVSLSSVIGPTLQITSAQQELFNIDATSGKSINALRAFIGKGTMVWGARTLAGNDNEWRYVNVRRLFIMIEESAKKATAFAVFEANDTSTWLKVKGMLESYLYGLWEQGALQGSKPEAAFYVSVGLGKTMTPQDVLEGRMIVEIGIAAVRPAEFIVLRFSHKLPEA